MKRKIGVQSTIFGQNKPFKRQIGKIKQALDIDFVEVKPHYHPDLMQYYELKDGKLCFDPKVLKKIKRLCGDLQFQVHFRDTIDYKLYGICGDKSIVQFYLDVAKGLNDYFDDFVLTIHMMYAMRSKFEIPLRRAVRNARKNLDALYDKWDFTGKLALETMMEPYVYKGAALLGYLPKHMDYFLKGKTDKFGICIDTGHLNDGLNNQASFSDFIHLPVREVHFHGNYSHKGMIDDLHTLPRKPTLKDYSEITDYLLEYEGMVNIEVTDTIAINWLRDIIKNIH